MRADETKQPSGYFKLLAPPFERCPKCGEMNGARVGKVWWVTDERGKHLECDVCAYVGKASAS